MIDKINSLLKRVEEFRPKAEAEIEEFSVRLLKTFKDRNSFTITCKYSEKTANNKDD